MAQLNEIQKFVAANYENGEYADVETTKDAKDVGDSLFAFLIAEAVDAQDFEEYQSRVGRASDQLTDLFNAITDKVLL